MISIGSSLFSPSSTTPTTSASAYSTNNCIARIKAGFTASISIPRSNLALASLLYPALLADFLLVAGVKYAASNAIEVVLSSISEFAPPKTPPKQTPLSLVAINTESVVSVLSTSSSVINFSPSSALLTQR